jgi:hypothetical protein
MVFLIFVSFLFSIDSRAAQATYPTYTPPFEFSADPAVAAQEQHMLDVGALEAEYTYSDYSHKAEPYGENEYTKYMLSNSYMIGAVPLAEEMTYDKLLEVISTKKLTTIESVIAELPEHMKNNFILMYNSRSLQDASPTSPRAIVYTPTTSFVIAFNGGKKNQKGYNTIEAIQFRHDQKRFEFHELTFDGKGLPVPSEANPKKCVECHQSPDRKEVDMRFNWEPYSTWLGAFGANHGVFTGKMTYTPSIRESLKDRLLPQDTEALDQQETEYELFKNYVENVHYTHPRFSLLGKPNLHAPTNFTQQANLLGMFRIMRLINANKPVADLYRELLMASSRCLDPEKQTWKDKSPAIAWMLDRDYSRYYTYTPYDRFATPAAPLTVFFESIGIDTTDWSMDFGNGGRFAFRDRFGTPALPGGNFTFAMIAGLEDGLGLFLQPCEKLEATGFAKLDAAFKDGTLQKWQKQNQKPEATGAEIVARCVKCHVDGMDDNAPVFPFDDPAKMAAQLAKPYSGRGTLFDEINYRTSDMSLRKYQMPPGRRLSQKEHETLMKYLKEMK